MFKVNDTVLYRAHGVCKVIDISKKKFSSDLMEYYVLKPVYDEKMIVYVPVLNVIDTEIMRTVLSISQIEHVIYTMPDEEQIWIENDIVRKEKYTQILKKGDRVELVKLIKTLYLHQQSLKEKGKKLHSTDENYFKEAEKLLYEEFAYVLNIQREEVLPFILKQVNRGKVIKD